MPFEAAHPQFQVEQQTIAEGSEILAIGVVTRDHESRELVLCAQGYDPDDPADPDPTLPGSLVVADQSRDALLARLTRGPRSTLALAIGAAVLLVAGSMLLAR